MTHLAPRQAKAGTATVALGLVVVLTGISLGVGAIHAATHNQAQSLPPEGLPPELPAEVRACAVCHLNPGLRPSYRDGTGRLHQDYIDAGAYVASIHFRNGKQKCTDCHSGDYSRFPHPATNPTPACRDCHEKFEEEYRDIEAAVRESVHHAGGDGVSFDCATCHSPHSMKPAREMTIDERNAACIGCHEGRFNTSGLTLAQRHAWHPQAALHLDRVACIVCHTQPSGSGYSFRHDIRPRGEATSDCYACHGANTKMVAYGGSFEGGTARPYTRAEFVRAYYLSGGTRYSPLDRGGLLFMLLVVVGTAGHGLVRFVRSRRSGP